ncbi:hypothetical protein FGG08_006529 [Glutinoglossum americanum]|uniref:Uncharacterized protein n=1 Tax=Glutinoglossum americanum TaxID=1670608 RepID=A0A9P8HW54_9PEZI|nr:hypothetical protein FGG08_006529 [Glutinoglossum americanum]
MGFLQLIPADTLSALYDTREQVLILGANGNLQDFTSEPSFKRLPLPGGLKFELEGWVGPLTGKTSPYTVSQKFRIPLPNRATPSDFVIIVDQNHPKGIPVKILFTGLSEPSPGPEASQVTAVETTPASAEVDTSDSNQILISGEVNINVLYKESFQIKEAASVPSQGRVLIKFDPSFIELQDASIQDKDIVWTLNSLQTGRTQVIVTIEGGIAQFHITKIYDVFVFIPFTRPPLDDEIQTFTSRVNVAINRIKEQYPDAQLNSVEGTPASPGGVTSPNEITNLLVICQADNGTATIESTGWDEWGPVQYDAQPLLGNNNIPWPIEMDAIRADQILKEGGFKGPYLSMSLRWPLSPDKEEPYYIFTMVDGPVVFVGVNSGKVIVDESDPGKPPVPPTPYQPEGTPYQPKGTPYQPKGTPYQPKGPLNPPEGPSYQPKGPQDPPKEPPAGYGKYK